MGYRLGYVCDGGCGRMIAWADGDDPYARTKIKNALYEAARLVGYRGFCAKCKPAPKPPKPIKPPKPPKPERKHIHPSASCYRNHKCRCRGCKAARMREQQRYRADRKIRLGLSA